MAKDTSWKKLSEKTLFTHPRITIYEDEVELPSGESTHYLRFGDGNGSACVLAINDENKILVQKEYSYPPDEWLYQFPGGGIQEGESPEQGAMRELAEEASLATEKLELLGWFYPDNRRYSSKLHVYLATGLSPDLTAKKDAEEEFEDYWFSEAEIDEMVTSGKIVNYSALAAWGFFKARAKK